MNQIQITRVQSLFAALVLAVTLLGVSPLAAAGPAGVVNVNTADSAELQLLPRIGPAVAERIVAYRDANGRFESPEELMLVRGIGERTFDLLSAHVTLEGETTLSEKVRVRREAEEEGS